MMKPSNPSSPPLRERSVPKKSYKLGEDIKIAVHTDCTPEPLFYECNLKTEVILENGDTATLIIMPDDQEKIIIHMTLEQVKAIRKALKIIIKRLGGNK